MSCPASHLAIQLHLRLTCRLTSSPANVAVAFGADFNGLETGGLYEAFETVIFTLTVRTGQLPGAQYLPTAANRKFDAALRQLDDAVKSIVQV